MDLINLLKARRYIKRDWQLYKNFYVPSKNCVFIMDMFKDNVSKYVESLRKRDHEYIFSNTCSEVSLYASCYACMIKGILGQEIEDKKGWKQYFDSFQRNDGLFVDPVVKDIAKYEAGDGFGARHLLPHLCIAYERLGGQPAKEFSFLDQFSTPDSIIHWLETLDMEKIYATSNKIMNIISLMQYARDKMGANNSSAVSAAEEWLINKINRDYGMWTPSSCRTKIDVYNSIRGSYHIFLILYYDDIEIPSKDILTQKIIDLQNVMGGFDIGLCSSACYDIDAIDPLLRYSNDPKSRIITKTLQKSFKWILANQNEDGGFVFQRYIPFSYGGETELSSISNESNLFATWFRTLSIAYIYNQYHNESDFEILSVPGYEQEVD